LSKKLKSHRKINTIEILAISHELNSQEIMMKFVTQPLLLIKWIFRAC